MSLIERQVEATQKENAINKRLIDNSYKAIMQAKKIKETSEHQAIIQSEMFAFG